MTVDIAGRDLLEHGDVPSDDPRIVALELEAPVSAAAVFRNLNKIKPLIRADAAQSDLIGRTTPLVGRAMRDAGLFQMSWMKARGGIEMSVPDQLEVITQVARIDGGAGWTVSILNASGYYASFLEDEAYAMIYPDGPDTPTAFSGFPPAKAVEVEGGYYLEKGRWDWGSGGYHADRFLGGAKVWDKDGNPVLDSDGDHLWLGIWLPTDKVTQAHDWNPLGLRASGSSGYYLTEPVVVPREHTFDYHHPARNYGFVLMGVAVGLAQHMIDLAVEALRKKSIPDGPGGGQYDRTRLSEAMMTLDLLVFGLRGMAEHLQNVAEARPPRTLTPDEGITMAGVGPAVRDVLIKLRDTLQDIYGSSFTKPGNEFGRVLRDIYVAFAHLQFKWSDATERKSTRADRLITGQTTIGTVLDAGWPTDYVGAQGVRSHNPISRDSEQTSNG